MSRGVEGRGCESRVGEREGVTVVRATPAGRSHHPGRKFRHSRFEVVRRTAYTSSAAAYAPTPMPSTSSPRAASHHPRRIITGTPSIVPPKSPPNFSTDVEIVEVGRSGVPAVRSKARSSVSCQIRRAVVLRAAVVLLTSRRSHFR